MRPTPLPFEAVRPKAPPAPICFECPERGECPACGILKRCQCGLVWTRDTWPALELKGHQAGIAGHPGLELRNCLCGSTLGVML